MSFLLASVGAVVLGIVLSAALVRPAGAATLPLPSAPTLPVPVGGGGTITNTVSGLVNSVTVAASSALPVPPTSPVTQLPIAKLPVTQLPLPGLPLPALPVMTKPGGINLTSGVLPAGTTGAGTVPGIGGPAHGHSVKLSDPAAGRRTMSTSFRTSHSSTAKANANGTPARTPAPRVPSPSYPPVLPIASDTAAPGHGGSLWNALPLSIALLALAALGGVFLRRRISPAILFASRPSPPG